MVWTVWLDLSVIRDADRLDVRFRRQLAAIRRMLQEDGPAAIKASPWPAPTEGASISRHGSVDFDPWIFLVRIEILPEQLLIIRSAWSFEKPDWF